MPPAAPRLRYISGFDGVRGIAAVAVFLFHTGHLQGGFLGVDLFFPLSGFLITTLLLVEFDRAHQIDVKSFWSRRLRRLAPALVLVVVVTYLLVALVIGVDTAQVFWPQAVSVLFYVSNWYLVAGPTGPLTPYNHAWSLAVEAQFYLVWPIVAVLATRGIGTDRRRLATRLLVIAMVGVGVSAGLTQALYTGPDSLARLYYGTDTHASGILLGCALACVLDRWGTVSAPRPRLALKVAGWLALVGIVAAWIWLRRDTPALYEWGLDLGFSLLAVVLIADLAHADTTLLSRVLTVTPLRQLGVISYGVYVWHWIIVYLTPPDRLPLTEWWRFGAQAGATLIVATLSYRYVERPIRRGDIPLRRPRAPIPEPDRS